MKDRLVKFIIFISLAIILFILILVKFRMDNGFQPCETLQDIDKSQIRDYDKSQIRDYIQIIMEEPRLQYNKTNPEGTVDNDFCNMIYKVSIKNITDKDIELAANIFVPYELYETIIMSEKLVGQGDNTKTITPNKKINFTSGALLIHTQKLSREQSELLDKLKNKLYFQILLNGKEYYIRYNRNGAY